MKAVYSRLTIEHDIESVTEHIEAHLLSSGALRTVARAEMISYPFFRGMGAYLVGRLYSGSHRIPFILALIQSDVGLIVDGVILDEDATSILFNFARSYFHVEIDRPYDLVHFLRSIMPPKRIADLYIAIGYNKYGKTKLYRDPLHHLTYSDDQFERARRFLRLR